jgi:hypothetical protein
MGEWDFASGAAQPKNAALFASPLTVNRAILSWDGYLLVKLPANGP